MEKIDLEDDRELQTSSNSSTCTSEMEDSLSRLEKHSSLVLQKICMATLFFIKGVTDVDEATGGKATCNTEIIERFSLVGCTLLECYRKMKSAQEERTSA